MNKYGDAAILAARLCRTGLADSPPHAWEAATIQVFGSGTPSQEKGCPRGAFLGLCEEGLVKGISPGSYTGSRKNKKYAVDAVQILRQRPFLRTNKARLWHEVLGGVPKAHNNQMDVVIALWDEGLIQNM